jgi:hypothetical protein
MTEGSWVMLDHLLKCYNMSRWLGRLIDLGNGGPRAFRDCLINCTNPSSLKLAGKRAKPIQHWADGRGQARQKAVQIVKCPVSLLDSKYCP